MWDMSTEPVRLSRKSAANPNKFYRIARLTIKLNRFPFLDKRIKFSGGAAAVLRDMLWPLEM